MGGYIVLDKSRAAPTSDIVVILSNKNKKKTGATIVSKKGVYYSKTSAKKLAERFR